MQMKKFINDPNTLTDELAMQIIKIPDSKNQ